MDEHLVALVARGREVGAALGLDPDNAELTGEAQHVGSELLTKGRREGVSPVLAMLTEGQR